MSILYAFPNENLNNNNKLHFSTGVKRVIGGHMDLTGKKSEGRLAVKYDTTPISTTSTLTILDTDYDNYAVIWSCSGLGPINARKYSFIHLNGIQKLIERPSLRWPDVDSYYYNCKVIH